MRFLLDAHVSGPRVEQRYEVRALDQEPALEGLDDDDVLALAAAEERILVTHNIRDFPAILRDWAAAEHSHAGAILVYGIDYREFDVIVRGIELCLTRYPEPARWRDLSLVVNRDFAQEMSGRGRRRWRWALRSTRISGVLLPSSAGGIVAADIAEPLRIRRSGRGARVVGANQPVFRL